MFYIIRRNLVLKFDRCAEGKLGLGVAGEPKESVHERTRQA